MCICSWTIFGLPFDLLVNVYICSEMGAASKSAQLRRQFQFLEFENSTTRRSSLPLITSASSSNAVSSNLSLSGARTLDVEVITRKREPELCSVM